MSAIAVPPSAEGVGIFCASYRTVNWHKQVFLLLIHNDCSVRLNPGNAESFTPRRLNHAAHLRFGDAGALGHATTNLCAGGAAPQMAVDASFEGPVHSAGQAVMVGGLGRLVAG